MSGKVEMNFFVRMSRYLLPVLIETLVEIWCEELIVSREYLIVIFVNINLSLLPLSLS